MMNVYVSDSPTIVLAHGILQDNVHLCLVLTSPLNFESLLHIISLHYYNSH